MRHMVFGSKRATTWLVFFIGCEAVFVVLLSIAIAAQARRTIAEIFLLNLLFSSCFVSFMHWNRGTHGLRFETDGSTWIRLFGSGQDVIVRWQTFIGIERNGLTFVVRSTTGDIVVTPDCWGYSVLRELAESWDSERSA